MFAAAAAKDLVEVGTITDNLSKASKTLSKKEKVISCLKSAIKYGQAAAYLTTAVTESIKFVKLMSKGEEDSKEFKFLMEQFAVVNTKLDSLDQDFREVKSQIDWTTLSVNLGSYESSIEALYQMLKIYGKAPTASKEVFKEMFLSSYHYEYDDATRKIYNSLTSKGIFHDDIFVSVRRRFKEDYRLVAQFMTMMMRTLQKGRLVEAAYLQFERMDHALEHEKEIWVERQKKLEEVARKVDADVAAAWASQYKLDVDEFALRNAASLNNKEMVTQLYKLLTDKYPWRLWFVLVHKFTDNNDKDRYYDICYGHSKVNVADKVVIVTQLPNPPEKAAVDVSSFWDPIRSTNNNPWGAYAVIAKRLFFKLDCGCDLYRFKGVIEYKADVQSKFPEGRGYVTNTYVKRILHSSAKKYILTIFA